MGSCLCLHGRTGRESDYDAVSSENKNDLKRLSLDQIPPSKPPSKWPNPKDVPVVPFQKKRIKVLVYSVYDGDTCSILIPFGGEFIRLNIRVNGIDTPEVKVKGPAKGTSIGLLEEEAAKHVRDKVKQLIEGKECDVILYKWDKYGGRVIGDVYLENGGTLSEYLLEKGYAKKYSGNAKDDWEEDELRMMLRTQ